MAGQPDPDDPGARVLRNHANPCFSLTPKLTNRLRLIEFREQLKISTRSESWLNERVRATARKAGEKFTGIEWQSKIRKLLRVPCKLH